MHKREQTLLYVSGMRSFHLFSPLLKGDEFHAYLTAQEQNAVPRIFVFSNIANLQKLESTLLSTITTRLRINKRLRVFKECNLLVS